MKFTLAQIVLSAALLSTATVAVADTLAPNTAIVGPVGTTAAAEPQLAGRVVEDVTTPFSYTGWFEDASSGRAAVNGEVTGSVRSRVVLSRDGTYDFYWRVTVAGNSFLPVAALSLSGLAPATYNANWRSDDPGSVQPAVIMEQASGEVNWRFGQYIPPSTEVYPGQKSYFLFLDTDARFYSRTAFFSLLSERDSGGSIGIQWGGESGLYPAFAPSSVPESSSRHGAPPAVANAYIDGDAFLKALSGRKRGCIISKIAEQQARFAAYGPQGGPYDEGAIRAAALSYSNLCQ
jgi:hypothetical protein